MTDGDPAPSLKAIFLAFFTMGLVGFGGVMPWARRIIVEQRRWMTPEGFNEAFALCQFLPGPNIVNFSIIFGARFYGFRGAVVAVMALLGPPTLVVMVFGALYQRFGDIAALQRVLSGVAAAACGLILATALKMIAPVARSRSASALAIVAVAFVGVGVLRWPIQWVLLTVAPLSIALSWWSHR